MGNWASEARTAYRLQITCEHVSLELDLKLVRLSAVRTNEGRLFQTVRVQHENRREAVFVHEDCVDSRSDADDTRLSVWRK